MTRTERDRTANALTVRPFRLLWLNNIPFYLVVNAQRFAFGWIVLDLLLRAEGAQGFVAFTLGIPTALIVLQAGVWADRHDRRRLLIGTQLASATVMAGTALLIRSGHIEMGWVIIATLLAGTASAVGQPVRSSLVPALVGRDQLFGAIALNAIAMTLSLILGPVLVKVVGDQFGFEGAFWFQAGLLIVGTMFLLMLEVPDHEEVRERRPVVAEVREAVRHILGDSQLKTLFGLLLTGSLTVNPAVMVTLQAHVKSELGRDAGDAAIPFAMMGIGIAISSLFLMRKGDMANKGAVFQRAMMVSGATTLMMGFADSFAVVVGLSLVIGLSGGFFINMNQGLIQTNTPQPLMGRVMAVYTLVAQGLFPVGALLLGLLATVIGTGAAISLAAAISLSIVTTTYVRNAELRRLA
jgi:MFS family permease